MISPSIAPHALAGEIAQALGGKRRQHGWTVRCPAHDDTHPSLDLTIKDGTLLFICRAGCSQEAVLAELRQRQLWPLPPRVLPPPPNPGRRLVASHEYRDPASGALVGTKERYEWSEGGGGTTAKSFTWRRPDGTPGLNGATMPLYRGETLRDLPATRAIEIPEGEKCVEAFWRVGMAAVCPPNGAANGNGEGWARYAEALRGRTVRLWPDNDDAGRAFMASFADALYGVAAEVKIVTIPGLSEKGDVADYLAAGYTRGDLELLASAAAPWTPEHRFSLAELLGKEIPPLKWAIEGILPEGLTLFGGKSKMGKSWAALSIALAIASGSLVFGSVPATQGDVLYLALEDYARRLQDRVRMLIGDAAMPAGHLEFWTACPRLDDGGIERLEGWLRAHPATRLVVIDTLKQIRPRGSSGRSAYDEDYDCLQPLFHLAQRLRVSVMVIHHLRKDSSGDPLDQLNGTMGLSASADGALILVGRRGQNEAVLHVNHRDNAQHELALTWDPETVTWTIAGDAEEYRMSKARKEVIEALEGADSPLGPKEVAEMLGRRAGAVRKLMAEMSRQGNICLVDRGRYTTHTGNHGNYGNYGNNGNDPVDGEHEGRVVTEVTGITGDTSETA